MQNKQNKKQKTKKKYQNLHLQHQHRLFEKTERKKIV